MQTLQDFYDQGLEPCDSVKTEVGVVLIFNDLANEAAFVWQNKNGKEEIRSFQTRASCCGQCNYEALAQARVYVYGKEPISDGS